ncbi:hypothetical protein IFM89_025863 [Coptis chinensis]|uniref:GED domain-containing protein n=1 Tax=Coptis chinensis TaxID=261450 RepID=A0A835GY09_9MAGN|nr:hypothetical protein IFM89_025863 [Coptis chinensis]
MTAFMQILGSTKESLRKILVRGEFDEYLDDAEMHCTVRMAEMLEKYTKQLQLNSDESTKDNFLMEEIAVLEETKLIGLPNFLSRTAFLTILQRKLKKISGIPIELVEEKSFTQPDIEKDRSVARVKEMVEMEKLADYTCDPEYMLSWNSLMAEQDMFMNAIARLSGGRNEVCAAAPTAPESVACAVACDEVFWRPSGGRNDVWMAPTAVGDGEFNINGYGEVEIGHLKGYPLIVEQAFDMRMRITAYWKIVLKRMLDNLALHLLFNVQNLVNKEMETEIINEMMGSNHIGSIERFLEESPSLGSRREKLNKSIRVLKQSKDIVSKIMDRIVVYGDNVDY